MPGQSPLAGAFPDGAVVDGAAVDGVVVVDGVVAVPVSGAVAVAVVGVVVALEPVVAAYALVPPTRAPAIESIATVFLMCAFMVFTSLCVVAYG
jgi:hypothetical protein